MSLINPERQWRIGVIMSKGFDNPDCLADHLEERAEQILALYTNGVNPIVIDFCVKHGVTCTIFPISRSAPWSNQQIVKNSDKIFIFAAPGSKNTQNAVKECEALKKQFELVEYEAVAMWRDKVCKAREALEAIPKDEIDSSPVLKVLAGIL